MRTTLDKTLSDKFKAFVYSIEDEKHFRHLTPYETKALIFFGVECFVSFTFFQQASDRKNYNYDLFLVFGGFFEHFAKVQH